MRIFRQEPDVVAVAVLALLMLVPAAVQARPPRRGEAFRIRPVSENGDAVFVNPDSMDGFENLVGWTDSLERRGERVWQRLSERMRLFEERFEKLSTAPPRLQSIHCETDSE